MLASDSNDIKGTTNITSNYVITAALPISSLGQQRLQATFVAEINVDFSTKSVCTKPIPLIWNVQMMLADKLTKICNLHWIEGMGVPLYKS